MIVLLKPQIPNSNFGYEIQYKSAKFRQSILETKMKDWFLLKSNKNPTITVFRMSCTKHRHANRFEQSPSLLGTD